MTRCSNSVGFGDYAGAAPAVAGATAARPDQTRPDQTRTEQTTQDQTSQDQIRPDQTRQDQTRPDKSRPAQTREDETNNKKSKTSWRNAGMGGRGATREPYLAQWVGETICVGVASNSLLKANPLYISVALFLVLHEHGVRDVSFLRPHKPSCRRVGGNAVEARSENPRSQHHALAHGHRGGALRFDCRRCGNY